MSATHRRTTGAISAIGLATLAIAGCGGESLEEGGGGGEEGTVKIGLLIPTSGVFAPLGEDMREGFELYLQQHDNMLGGQEVEVVEVDEGEDPQTAVPAAQRLIQQDQVDVVTGLVNSASGLALRDVFQEAEVPFIVSNAGNSDITAGAEYVWRTSFVNEDVGGALGPYVAEQAGGDPIFLIASDYEAGREFTAGFRRSFEEAGGEIAGEAFPPFGSTSNYQPFLADIERSDAAGAFAFFAGSEAVTFVEQYASFGLDDDVQLYGTGFLTEGGVLEAQGDNALGVQTSLHYSSQLDNPVNEEFVAAYQDEYDGLPTNYAVNSYDAAAVLDQALEAGAAPEQIVEGLESIGEVESPRGSWSFDENHDPDQTYYLREVSEQGDGIVNEVLRELPGG